MILQMRLSSVRKLKHGSGWGSFRKGERVTRVADLATGDLLLMYSILFDAYNVVEIMSLPDGFHPFPDRRYGRFVDPDNTSQLRADANPQGFCIWEMELAEYTKLWRAVR